MASNSEKPTGSTPSGPQVEGANASNISKSSKWAFWKKQPKTSEKLHSSTTMSDADEDGNVNPPPPKWSLGILNDKLTDEVPGE
jgi:hypothetical protein